MTRKSKPKTLYVLQNFVWGEWHNIDYFETESFAQTVKSAAEARKEKVRIQKYREVK